MRTFFGYLNRQVQSLFSDRHSDNKKIINLPRRKTQVYVLAVGALAIMTLTACEEIATPDGRVPEKFQGQAAQWLGTYQGALGGRVMTLTLTMSDRRPEVQVVAADGTNDLWGGKCQSKVGQMKSVRGSRSEDKQGMDQYELDYVTFAFDPGACSDRVMGRDLMVFFQKTSLGPQIKLQLLKEERIIPGRIDCHPSGRCFQEPDQVIPVYVKGDFDHTTAVFGR